jgi:hypothetical protein
MFRSMKRMPVVLLLISGSRLAVVIWVILSNVTLRDTPLGVVAAFLDKLPPSVGAPLFIFFWVTFLLGWAVLAGVGIKAMLHRGPRKQ